MRLEKIINMKKIYKYTIPVQEKYQLELPKGSRIIRVEDVEGLFFLWAIVDTETEEREIRCLEFYKTGQPIETPIENLTFRGTCKLFIMQELCLYVFENDVESRKNTLLCNTATSPNS